MCFRIVRRNSFRQISNLLIGIGGMNSRPTEELRIRTNYYSRLKGLHTSPSAPLKILLVALRGSASSLKNTRVGTL